MPQAACSEAVLNPLPCLLHWLNGCWGRPCVAGEALNGHEVPFLGFWLYPLRGSGVIPFPQTKVINNASRGLNIDSKKIHFFISPMKNAVFGVVYAVPWCRLCRALAQNGRG